MKTAFCVLALAVLLVGCSDDPDSAGPVSIPAPAQPAPDAPETAPASGKVVITDEDDEAIRIIIGDFLKHIRKPEISFRSDMTPYLNCDARRELLEYGWKAVPYLIEQVVRNWNVHPYLGSALIEDKNVRTPEEVFEWNRKRKNEVMASVLPNFVIDAVLRELPSGEVAPVVNKPEGRRGGYHYCELFAWVKWWRENRGRFEFRTQKPLAIPEPAYEFDFIPGIHIDKHDGVFDIFALSDTYENIIRHAAGKLEVKVLIGEQRHLDVITTVHMRSVTFHEFLHMLRGHGCLIKYGRAGDTYWVGD